jgi:hypothetical protein
MSARHRAAAGPPRRVRNRPPDPPAPTQPAQPAQSIQPAQAIQPARSTQPARPARSSRLELRNAPALTVVVLAGLGLAYVALAPKHWLRGVLVMAFAMGVAALLRTVLPARQVGLLAVRSRFLDALWYAGIAAAMVILGLWLRASGRT